MGLLALKETSVKCPDGGAAGVSHPPWWHEYGVFTERHPKLSTDFKTTRLGHPILSQWHFQSGRLNVFFTPFLVD